MRSNLVDDLLGELGPSVVHDQHDRGDFQCRVQALAHKFHIADQLTNTLKGVVLTLNRYKHLCSSHQRVDREQPERWRAIDEDVVVVIDNWSKGVQQTTFPVKAGNKFNLGSGKVEARGSHKEALDVGCRFQRIFERGVTQKNVVHVLLDGARVNPQAR